MANIKSAKKRVRKIARQTAVNASRKSRIKTFVRKVHEAIEAKDKAKAQEAFKAMQPELMRGATKGVIKKNTVSRTLSRLSARIKTIA